MSHLTVQGRKGAGGGRLRKEPEATARRPGGPPARVRPTPGPTFSLFCLGPQTLSHAHATVSIPPVQGFPWDVP